MKTYVGYVRVSTPRQGEGVSPTEQRRLIEEYASRQSLQITGWFEEKATAAKLGRKAFNQMVAELEAGQAQGVIIHKIDRSARNLSDWARLNQLFDRGIDVRFVHEGIDFSSRSGRLTGDILAVVAADFIRNNRDETLKGFYGRLNQGLYPLPAPLGYLNRGKGKPKEVDPIAGPLIRQMFDLYASGRYSLWTLRTEMTKRGLRSRAGKPLARNALSRMLSDPFYIGIIKIRRRNETFQGVHEPLVAKRDFDRVQSILAGRYHTKVRTHTFLFRRLMRCVRCGNGLYGERQKGHVYYRCQTRGCYGTSLRETSIAEKVSPRLAAIRFDDVELRDLRDLAAEDQASAGQLEEARIGRLKGQLTLLEGRLTRLTDAVIDGLIDKGTFEDRKAPLLGERRELLDAIERPECRQPGGTLLERLELGSTAYPGFISLIPDEQREAVERTVSNLSVEGKELGIVLRFPFEQVAAARLSNNCAPSGATSRKDSNSCELRNGIPVAMRRFSKTELKALWRTLRVQTEGQLDARRDSSYP